MRRAHVRSLAGLGTLALLAALPPLHRPLQGQTAGATVPVTYTLPFSTRQQSMWGPANAPSNIDFTVQLFHEGWSTSGSANGILSIPAGFGTQFGGSISASTSGAIGLAFRIFDIGTGAVNLDYPVRVVLDVPEPNSFRDGDAVTIGSHFELLPGWSLATSPPGGSFTLLGTFGAALGASGQICIVACVSQTLVNFGLPTDPFELFSITSEGRLTIPTISSPFWSNPLVIETLPYEFGGFLEPFGPRLGFTGPVDAPRVLTTAAVGTDGRTLVATGQHRFVDLTADLDQYLSLVGVPPLGFQTPPLVPVSDASFGYEVVGLDLLFGVIARQAFTFAPRVTVAVHFPADVAFAILNGDGSPAGTGHGTDVSFDVGQSLRVTVPGGSRDPLPGTPTYGLANTFSSQTAFDFNEQLVVRAGSFNLHTPTKAVSHTVTTTVCNVFGTILSGFLKDACEAIGGFLEDVTETVTQTVPPVDVNLGPLVARTLVDETQPLPLFPTGGGSGQWELQGLRLFTEAPFALDPEDPRIAVATDLASAQLAVGGPAGAILQTVRVRNEGDVPLSAAELRDALSALISGGPFQVLNVSSPTLTTDPAFDGTATPGLLAGGNALPVGAEGVVKVTLGVTPGSIYRADVRAGGTSPIGTAVAAEAAAALGVVAFEIIPDQVSAWSQGVLPTRIRSQGLDAGRVDPASVMLEGASPSQWNLTSSGDLILKFPLQEVLSGLDQRLLRQVTIAAATAAPAASAVTLADVVAAVLGETGRLDDAAIAGVDRAGNGNGALDLGDLRALVLVRRAERAAVVLRVGSSAALSDLRVLVVTGSLGDGTRFFGEDDLAIMNGGN